MRELSDVHTLLGKFSGVSLEELDDRAALLRRIDHKYAVDADVWLELADQLREDHEVLEINGRRKFAYRTTYFETPEQRCFFDHVEGRAPRFKARSRLYEDTGTCVFEVKLKRGDGEMDKRQLDYAADQRERLSDPARRCLEQALHSAGLETPDLLRPSLETSFHRVTLAARGGSERLTCDFGVRLANTDDRAVKLREGLVLVETKTEDGDSPADRALGEMDIARISLSKYRVGMALVGGAPVDGPQPGSEFFG